MTIPAIDPTPTAHDFLSTPGADIRDAGEAQLSALRRDLNSDFFLFFAFFFNYPEFALHWHKPICDFVQRWGEPGWRRLAISIPRGTGKTTCATKANALWQVCRSPGHNATVALFNAKESRAKSWVGAIREFVEASREFQLIYRDMLPDGVSFLSQRDGVRRGWPWSDSELRFVRTNVGVPEASISGHGATGAAAGYHFSHIIKDDIIELRHALSPLEMERAKEWVDNARHLESPAGQGCDFFVYTRWAYNDVYRHFMDVWPNEYKIFHRKALEEDPETGEEFSSFPEKWTAAELRAERERDTYNFNAQYQSTPMAGRDVAFDPAWLRYGTIETHDDEPCFVISRSQWDPNLTKADDGQPAPRIVPLWQCDMAVLWDPAPSEETDRNRNTHARNGKIAVALDPYGRELVLEARGTRRDPVDEMLDTIHLCHRWAITKVAVEEVNFSKVYRHFANYILRRDFPESRIQFLKQKQPRSEKDTRIRGLMPLWREGFVYLNEPETQPLITEMQEFPYGTTRDILDAYAMKFGSPAPLSRPLTLDESFDLDLARNPAPRPGALDNVNWPAGSRLQ